MSINPPNINAIREFYDIPQYKRLVDECLGRGIKTNTLTEAINAVKEARGHLPIGKNSKWLRRSIYWAAMVYIHSRRYKRKDSYPAIAEDLRGSTGLPYEGTQIRRFYKEFANPKSNTNSELSLMDENAALPEPIHSASPSPVAIGEGVGPRSSPYQELTYQPSDPSLLSPYQPPNPCVDYANTVGASQSRNQSVDSDSSFYDDLLMQPHGQSYYAMTVGQASPSNPPVQPFGWTPPNYNASLHQPSLRIAPDQCIDPALFNNSFLQSHDYHTSS